MSWIPVPLGRIRGVSTFHRTIDEVTSTTKVFGSERDRTRKGGGEITWQKKRRIPTNLGLSHGTTPIIRPVLNSVKVLMTVLSARRTDHYGEPVIDALLEGKREDITVYERPVRTGLGPDPNHTRLNSVEKMTWKRTTGGIHQDPRGNMEEVELGGSRLRATWVVSTTHPDHSTPTNPYLGVEGSRLETITICWLRCTRDVTERMGPGNVSFGARVLAPRTTTNVKETVWDLTTSLRLTAQATVSTTWSGTPRPTTKKRPRNQNSTVATSGHPPGTVLPLNLQRPRRAFGFPPTSPLPLSVSLSLFLLVQLRWIINCSFQSY